MAEFPHHEMRGDESRVVLLQALRAMQHRISIPQLIDGSRLSPLIKLGLNNLIMCEGGKFKSVRAVQELTNLEVPTLMLEGGIYHLHRVMRQNERKIVRNLMPLDDVVVIGPESIFRYGDPSIPDSGYGETLNRIPNLRMVEDVIDAVRYLRERNA